MVRVEELPALTAAELVADFLTAIVGEAARSVILHGSLSAGGFHPGRSDIDVLAVIDGDLAEAQVAALERLVRQADLGGASGLDLHVVTAAVVGAPTRAPALELHLGRYDRSSDEVEVARRLAAAPDLPAELSMARAARWAFRCDPTLTAVRQAVEQYEQDRDRIVDEQGIADVLDTVLRETARTR